MGIAFLWTFGAGTLVWLVTWGLALLFEYRTREIEKNLDPWSDKSGPARPRG